MRPFVVAQAGLQEPVEGADRNVIALQSGVEEVPPNDPQLPNRHDLSAPNLAPNSTENSAPISAPNSYYDRPESPYLIPQPIPDSAIVHPAGMVPTEMIPTIFSPSAGTNPSPMIAEPHVAPIMSMASAGCQTCGSSSCQSCGGMSSPSRLGRFAQGVYQGICCPDPCYQPQWSMLANASLFTSGARPQSRQRYRWDYNDDFQFQDRAEYLWGRSGTIGPPAERSIRLHELSMYLETGSDRFSFFVQTPYRSMSLDSGGHFAGFSDLTTGTKTLLHDTPLVQISFQFETHIPSSNPLKGLSNGHVSLEPSLICGVQLTDISYLQTQMSEWIPIAGDPTYAGALLKYSSSYNRILMGTAADTSLIGSLEFSGVSFQDGAYTDPVSGATVAASGETFASLGTGLRLNICNKLNVGIGALFNISENHWAESTLRTEIQFRH